MANATLLYACTHEGLFVFTKPGTLTEWLPPRKLLPGQAVDSVWAEPGPPIRVLAVSGGELMLSENGGRAWQPVEPFDSPAKVGTLFQAGNPPGLYMSADDGGLRFPMIVERHGPLPGWTAHYSTPCTQWAARRTSPPRKACE
jgi:hypothetical protein